MVEQTSPEGKAEKPPAGKQGPEPPLKPIVESRVGTVPKHILLYRSFLNSIAKRYPDLRAELKRAGIEQHPIEYIGKRITMTGMMTCGLTLVFFLVVNKMGVFSFPVLILVTILVAILMAVFFFAFFMSQHRVMMKKRMREIEKELIFAGKQMVIELKAGVPLFNAILSVSKGYGAASAEFAKIAEEISMGVPADIAMHNAAETNPSRSFRRIVTQVMNALRSGADVGDSLQAVLEQISKEKVIEIKRYGQTLNPLAMFYMLGGIIMPSLGATLFILVSSFVSINVGPEMLLVGWIFLFILQFIFLSVIESSRPVFGM